MKKNPVLEETKHFGIGRLCPLPKNALGPGCQKNKKELSVGMARLSLRHFSGVSLTCSQAKIICSATTMYWPLS